MAPEPRKIHTTDGMAASIHLPPLQNGVMAIGDLWDANSASRPGFNIFGKQFHGGDGEVTCTISRGVSESYTYHNKDIEDRLQDIEMNAAITAELLGGFIKLEGGLEFQVGFGHGHDTENIIWRYKTDTFEVMPKYNDMEWLREFVESDVGKKVKKGEIPATHFVSKVTLGANATASIDIRQSNQSTKYRVKTYLKGEIDLIALKASLDASAEVSENTAVSDYEKVIKLNCVPAVPPPTDLDQFDELELEIWKELQGTVYWERTEDEGNCVKATGVPKTFVLLPIEELLDGLEGDEDPEIPDPETDPEEEPEPTPGPPLPYPLPEPEPDPDPESPGRKSSGGRQSSVLAVKTNFLEAVKQLRDFTAAHFYKRLILNKRELLLKIMSDSEHALTRQVTSHEKELSSKAARFIRDIYAEYVNCVYDPDLWETGPMKQILEEVHATSSFQLETQEKRVNQWEVEGNKQLELVQIDEDENSPMYLFSSPEELGSWLRTERTVKLVLYCRTVEELDLILGDRASGSVLEKISKFPRALQLISQRLASFGAQVGIALPSASVADPAPGIPGVPGGEDGSGGGTGAGAGAGTMETRLSLQFKSRRGETFYEGEDDIEDVIHFLEALVGPGPTDDSLQPSNIKFYSVYAEQVGISIPMGGAGAGVSMRIEDVPEFVRFLSATTQHVNVYENVGGFTGAPAPPGRWRFVGPIQALDSVKHSLHALELLRGQDGVESGDFEFAVCNFETAGNDAPLLFVFEGTELCAICLDILDVLVLLQEMSAGAWDPSSTALSPSRCTAYSIAPLLRLKYAKDVGGLFGAKIPTFNSATSPVHAPAPEDNAMTVAATVAYALQIARCILDDPSRTLVSFPTALVHITRDMFEGRSKQQAAAFQELLDKPRNSWWSKVLDEVTPGAGGGNWQQMHDELSWFVGEQHGFLSLLLMTVEVLNGVAAEIEPEHEPEPNDPSESESEPDSDPEPEGPGTRDPELENDLGAILCTIRAHGECSPQLRQAIEFFDLASHHPRVLASFLAQFVQQEIGGVLAQDSNAPFAVLRQLMRLVDAARYSGGGSLARDVQEALVAQFTLPLATPAAGAGAGAGSYGEDPATRIELALALSSRSYFSLVTKLATQALPPTHRMLVTALGCLSSGDVGAGGSPRIVKLLQAIWTHFHPETADTDTPALRSDAAALEHDFLTYLWKNAKFLCLMLQHVENPLVLAALATFQCVGGVVPKFIPKPFVAPLKAFLAGGGGDGEYDYGGGGEDPGDAYSGGDPFFSWVWPDLAAALNAWRTFWTRSSMPSEFPVLLLKNMRTQDAFKRELLARVGDDYRGAAYWNEEQGHFDQPWDLGTLEMLTNDVTRNITAENMNISTRQIDARGRKYTSPSDVDISKLWEIQRFRPLNQQQEERHTKLIHWFDELQFGEDRTSLGTRFEMLAALVQWAYEERSVMALREMALALSANCGCAIPLLVCVAPDSAHTIKTLLLAPVILENLPLKLGTLFRDPFRMVTVLSAGASVVGPDFASAAWLLNTFYLKRDGVFTIETETTALVRAGYTEFITLSPQEQQAMGNENEQALADDEMRLVANVNGDALHFRDNAFLASLQRLTTRFVVFWTCSAWSLDEFRRQRQALTEKVLAGADFLEVCVNPTAEIARGLHVVGDNEQLIIYVDADSEIGAETETVEDVERKITRVMDLAFSSEAGPRRGVDSENLKPPTDNGDSGGLIAFPIPAPVEVALRIVRHVDGEGVKALKARLLPLAGAQADDAAVVEAHWRSQPSYTALMHLFVELLQAEVDEMAEHPSYRARPPMALGEGLAYLEQALSHLSSCSEESNRLRQQRTTLHELLGGGSSASATKRQEWLAQLRRTNCKLEHECSLTIPQMLSQILHVHHVAPTLIGSELAVPDLLANALLRGAALDLPSSATELVDSRLGKENETWYDEFMLSVQARCGRLFVVGVLGCSEDSDSERRALAVISRQKSNARASITAPPPPPHSGLRIRLVPFSAEFREEIEAATGDNGDSFDALLLVESPTLNEFDESQASREAERRLTSVLLATSHLTLIFDSSRQSSTSAGPGRNFLSAVLEVALLNRIALPAKIETRPLPLPQPNVLFLAGSQGADPALILQNVRSLASKYALESGMQASLESALTLLESKSVLGELVMPVADNDFDLVALHARILREILGVSNPNSDIERAGFYNLRGWADAVSRVWNLTGPASESGHSPVTSHVNATYAEFEFYLAHQLEEIRASISKAVDFHMQGYKQHIYNEISVLQVAPATNPDNSRRLVGALNFDDAVEEPIRPVVVKATILGWANGLLAGFYQNCQLEPQGGCDLCRYTLLLETKLLASLTGEDDEHRQRRKRVQETLAGYVTQARRTALQRVAQVLVCEELAVNQTDLLSEFELRTQEFGGDLSWKQFLSTKNILVGTWRRFFAELSSVYPPGFLFHFGFSVQAPPLSLGAEDDIAEMFEALQRSPAYRAPYGDPLNWEQFEILASGVKPLAESILRPPSEVVDGLQYSAGQVWQLKEGVTNVLAEVAPDDPTHRLHRLHGRLHPTLVWDVHFLGLSLLWASVIKMESDEWAPGGRYQPINYELIDTRH